MKKFLSLSLSLLVVALFCGAAFAQVGHVGHVDKDGVTVVDFTSPTVEDIVVEDGVTITVTPVTKEEVEADLPNFSFVGLPDDKTYEMTIYNAMLLDVTYSGAPLVLDFSAVGGNWTGIMLERTVGDVFDYFEKEGAGLITIDNPADYFSESGILFVKLKEASTPTGGGGGGGCSIGMLSPFALLLAVPLVLLRK